MVIRLGRLGYCSRYLLLPALLSILCVVYLGLLKDSVMRTPIIYSSVDNIARIEGQQDRAPAEKNRVKNILVVAYQRSGSTFTSEILQHGDEKSFFSMEPLWQTYRTCNIRSEGICCLNNKCRSPLHKYEEIEYALSVLQKIYTCNFNALSYKILKSFVAFPSTGQGYLRSAGCFQHKREKNVSHCVQHLTDLCRSSSVVIIKVLRIDMELARVLKTYLNNLSIIHLVRDPRAIMNSRAKGHFLSNDPLSSQSMALCSVMYKNIMNVQRYDSCFTLQFEHLAKEPELVVRRLYSYCGLNFTMETSRWLKLHTNASQRDLFQLPVNIKAHKITFLKNSMHVSQDWRRRMSLKDIGIIQNSCHEVLGVLGSRVFAGESELRNVSISVFSAI
ncbi:carbohydrate sulfotransferase 1-like isoform X2 [Magallana gigas]|uniref:carbohydrate sulfotransferase 1-like isoform X2 n=1 Tax=Magallana gigas TaxID=29159 RepID=UPI00333F639B